MQILHIVHQYLPEKVGGTELYTRTLSRQQARQGHSVAIVSPSEISTHPVDSVLEPETEDRVRVYRIPVGTRSAATVFRNSFGHKRLSQAFQRILQRERPELIHIQHLKGLPIRLVKEINTAGIPFIITLHDYWYLCANAQLLTNYDGTICPGPKWWLNCSRCALARVGHSYAAPLIPTIAPIFGYRHVGLQQVVREAKMLIAPSAFVRERYLQMGIPASKIKVAPHGIRVPEKVPAKQLPRNHLHVAYIGGLSWQKGVHILISAFNQLPTKGTKLSIIGDTEAFPDYVIQLQKLVEHPGITFKGSMPPSDLWQTLADIDLVVVPSLWYESSPAIIQEAFAAKIPVIASDIGALREAIVDGVDGLSIPSGNVELLCDALHRFLATPSLLKQLRAGIRPVRTIHEHLQQLETIYRQLNSHNS